MPYTITQEQFTKLMPKNTHVLDWVTSLNKFLPQFDINTRLRVAAFMSQTMAETNYTTLEENLYYSAAGLLKVFPSHFTAATAPLFANRPQAIANVIYANREGNGNVASGDGYKFRGRGILQITFKSMYSIMSQSLFKDDRLVTNPDYLTTFDGAVQSSCWFWNYSNISPLADAGNIVAVSKKVNGGTNGLETRLADYKLCLSVLT